ncbi:hypothetical protein [Novosphingobium beihaiensis]|uniref:DUF4349 domain-containing protein n=1 Tax=Novosphingobium beihaiensis TaxID=2930389 RepID=A0ABT0BS55_9SPHN|nr:hypothetical protein [Novosphingobium beihaiensis]MCJ2187896.1 hypothetical protein [Novosphingobium beihaiensis]
MNNRTKRALWLGIGLTPFVLCISTTMAVKGLTTAPALQADMVYEAGQWQTYVERQQTNPAAARSVADTLAPLKQSICTAAELESSGGTITGSGGPGAVSGALQSSCAGLKTILETIEAAAERDLARSKSLTEEIDRLRAIPEREDLSVFERQRAFRKATDKIKADLADGSAENLREKINAQLAVLRSSVIELEGEDGRFGARQAAAISNLKSQLGEVEKIVSDFLGAGNADEAQEMAEPADLLWSGAAIARWWPRMIPQIALGVAVDFIILWMAAFLAVNRASLREMQDAFATKERNRARPNRTNQTMRKGV